MQYRFRFLCWKLCGLAAFTALSGSAAAEVLTLEQALVSAYTTNPEILTQRKALATLDERVAQAVSGWRPTITASAEKGRQRFDSGAGWGYGDSEALQLIVRQPVYNGGGTVAATDAAEARVQAGRDTLVSTESDVFLRSVSAYMNTVRDSFVLDLSKNNENVLKQQLQAARERFEVGEVTRTDVAQSEARLAQARSDRIVAEGTLATSKANFRKLVGLEPEALRLPDTAQLPQPPETLEAAIERALNSNPDYLAAKKRVDAAREDIRVQQAGLLPSVYVQGVMRREEGAGVGGNLDFDNDVLTVNLEVPLYQGGAQHALAREAERELERVEQAAEVTRDQIVENVTSVWERIQTARASIKSTEAAVKAAEIALDGVKQEQLYGARTTLDVLDAEQELFVVRVELVRAQNREIVALYNLQALLGNLTARNMGLDVAYYDPAAHYDDVRNQWVGYR